MKPIYVLLFGLISLTWPGLTATAQSTLTGTVHDNAGKPVPFASVALLNARDSSVAKGTATNQQGQYAFERVGAGQYRVRASAVGYQKAYSTMIVIDNEPITAPMLILVELTGQLNTVQVTAKKPFVEQQIDRMVAYTHSLTVLIPLNAPPGDYTALLQQTATDGSVIEGPAHLQTTRITP